MDSAVIGMGYTDSVMCAFNFAAMLMKGVSQNRLHRNRVGMLTPLPLCPWNIIAGSQDAAGAICSEKLSFPFVLQYITPWPWLVCSGVTELVGLQKHDKVSDGFGLCSY